MSITSGNFMLVQIAEKEKEGLEGKKAEAEMFLKHQGSMLQKKITANEIFISRTGVSGLTKVHQQKYLFLF